MNQHLPWGRIFWLDRRSRWPPGNLCRWRGRTRQPHSPGVHDCCQTDGDKPQVTLVIVSPCLLTHIHTHTSSTRNTDLIFLNTILSSVFTFIIVLKHYQPNFTIRYTCNFHNNAKTEQYYFLNIVAHNATNNKLLNQQDHHPSDTTEPTTQYSQWSRSKQWSSPSLHCTAGHRRTLWRTPSAECAPTCAGTALRKRSWRHNVEDLIKF